MSIIIDLIIIAILALCIFFGYKNGLTKSIIKILSFVIAIVVAAIFFKPVSNLIIENTEIDDNIRQAVVNLVYKDVEESGEVKEDTNLPQAMVNYINDSVKNAVEDTKEKVVNSAANNIAITAINVASAVGLFIITRIALLIITAITDILTDLPVIKQFDKTGGVAYGIIKGMLIIFVIFAVISLISPAIEQTGIIANINKSFIGGFLYNNNLLLNIVL